MHDIIISKTLELFIDLDYTGLFISSMGFFPSEIIIILLASTHSANIWIISLISGLGGLIGSYPVYFLGYIFTEEKLYNWLDGSGKFLRIDKKKVEKSKKDLREKSFLYVFLTRLVPWLRIVASIAAGFIRVNSFSYSISVFLGGFCYALAIAYIGSQINGDLESIKRYIGLVDKWLLLVTVLIILILLTYKRRKKILKFLQTVLKGEK